MVVAGHGRVERDDAQAVDVDDVVHGRGLGRRAEQIAAERPAFVVVAHDPDQARLGSDGERLEHGAHPA